MTKSKMNSLLKSCSYLRVCNTFHQWVGEIGLMAVRHHGDRDNSLGLSRGETETRHMLKLWVLCGRRVDGASVTLAGRGSVAVQVSVPTTTGDVVASHPLFASLFKEISAKYPEPAALLPEISKVVRAAVATPTCTTTPGEQRGGHAQTLQEARDGEENPGGSSSQNGGAGGKKESGVRRTHSTQNGVVATRLATPTAQEMDIDESDAQMQEAGAALARARVESGAKRRKTNSGECNASAGAQAELDKAVDDAGHATRGGQPDEWGSATQSAQQV